jgi:hypothetical protein
MKSTRNPPTYSVIQTLDLQSTRNLHIYGVIQTLIYKGLETLTYIMLHKPWIYKVSENFKLKYKFLYIMGLWQFHLYAWCSRFFLQTMLHITKDNEILNKVLHYQGAIQTRDILYKFRPLKFLLLNWLTKFKCNIFKTVHKPGKSSQ